MFDGGHVYRSVIGPQTYQIVMEDDIHDPVQPVFDVPVDTNRGSKAPVAFQPIDFVANDVLSDFDTAMSSFSIPPLSIL